MLWSWYVHYLWHESAHVSAWMAVIYAAFFIGFSIMPFRIAFRLVRKWSHLTAVQRLAGLVGILFL